MADAAEENLSIVRFFDNPGGKGYDLTHIAPELQRYLNTLAYLFVGEYAGCLACGGYTSYIIEEILKRPRVAVTQRQTFFIGGPGSVDAAMLSRCLARMACYVRLATQCVDVEFPGWRCILAFTVFDVSGDGQKSTGSSCDFAQECWQRLGVTFGVPSNRLEEEANALTPMVRHQFALAGGKGTWAQAWAVSTQSMRAKKPRQVQCLFPVVTRLQAWDGVSTSVVEQGFSQITRVLGHWRSSTNACTRWTTAKIALDIGLGSPEWGEIVQRAQKIWLETWRPARRSGANTRRHFKVVLPGEKSAKMTETHWRRERAARIKSHVMSMISKTRSQIVRDATAASLSAWTDSHRKKESWLLSRQRHDKALATLGDEVLLPHEISAQNLADGAALGEKRRKLDAAHDGKRRRKQAELSRPPPFELHGVPIHCSTDLPSDTRKECMAYIAEKGGVMVSTGDLDQACLFVANNPGQPQETQHMVASLLGGAITCPLYLLSGGTEGSRVWLRPAMRTPRRLYMSISFIQDHAHFAGCIAAAVTAPSSKWMMIDTLLGFKDFCARDMARHPRSRRPMDVIVLLTDAEAHAERLHDCKNVFSKRAFCNFVASPDAASSACGTARL